MKYKFKLKVLITLLSLISIIFPINVASASESDNYAYNAIGQYGKLGTSNAGYEYKFTDAPGRGDNPGVTYIGAKDPDILIFDKKIDSQENTLQIVSDSCEVGSVGKDPSGYLWNAELVSVAYENCSQFATFKSRGYDFTFKPIIGITPGVAGLLGQETLLLSINIKSKTFPLSQSIILSTTGGTGSGVVTYSVTDGTATGCSLSSNSSPATLSATLAGTCLVTATKAAWYNYDSVNSSASTFTFAAIAPDAVTSLTATAGNTTCALSWTAGSANGSDITDYTIEYSTDGTNYSTFADGTSTATTATVTGLTNLTAYTLRVTAVNSIGSGSSTTVSCTPTAG